MFHICVRELCSNNSCVSLLKSECICAWWWASLFKCPTYTGTWRHGYHKGYERILSNKSICVSAVTAESTISKQFDYLCGTQTDCRPVCSIQSDCLNKCGVYMLFYYKLYQAQAIIQMCTVIFIC